MADDKYQANWRGARRYRLDEEVRRKSRIALDSDSQTIVGGPWDARSLPTPRGHLHNRARLDNPDPWRKGLADKARSRRSDKAPWWLGYLAGGCVLAILLASEFVPAAVGCGIKGNISYNTGENIYHVPGQEHYTETRISLWKGERWFCSEDAARKAGWRKSRS